MNLDLRLTQIGLKVKNFYLLDFSFPGNAFPEFKKAYDVRYISIPGRQASALAYASGLALSGKFVLIYGYEGDMQITDASLNIKLLKYDENGIWEGLESRISEFGPSVLLIPEEV